MKRYVKIEGKYPRELVLLKSNPCFHGKCIFCDYIDDNGGDFSINEEVLSEITGEFPLQVIDSASYFELPEKTLKLINEICLKKNVRELIIETHYAFYAETERLKEKKGNVIALVGAETFDLNFRRFLNKGMPDVSPPEIAKYFDWVNILFGIEGQTLDMLRFDVENALRFFKRMNLNIFVNNTTSVKRNEKLVEEFYSSSFFLEIKDNKNIDILDFADNRAPDNFLIG
jgi:hypothetical protein